ncbi:mannitol dehydrogenase family protein [Zobellia nedashkovskayae]|uniref:mannitol dehydrogenase family protein n=1 Tax=Zobellia nedashkovskayae TaxID=2779510 RepID=UPI00188D73D7|nr:mannitol dehydrogenase family protein [Zobellia nedashkovskayae]
MKESIELNQKNLSRLPKDISIPKYDRDSVTAGIVHIGVGGFHRSHEAVYTDMLLHGPDASSWGICGVGLREGDRHMADILKRQDHLYTLIVKHPDGKVETQVVGSIIDFMLSVDNPQAVIDKMADKDIKIVSLTITEGGYNFKPSNGEFDFDNADVKYDLANPETPKTVFGYLTAALRKRKNAGIPAFTVQSCDNIQHNGTMTAKMLSAFAERQDPELAQYIKKEVRFPNAMVDRITPVTTQKDMDYLSETFGLKDEWPVTCEPFHQWVIEDNFSNGRPAWENVGAQFVPDVTPYEKMKIRLLNAGHSVLGLLGSIQGFDTIDNTVSDPLFGSYLRKFMDIEVTPVLDTVEGVDLNAYKDSLIERFGNPNIKDNLARICLESSAKLPKFLIATIHDNLANGGSIKYATLVIAAWCYYSDKGVNQHNEPLDIVDAMKDELHEAAKETANDKLSFLKLESIFGNLIENQKFTEQYAEMIDVIYANPNVSEQMKKMV